MTPIRLGRLPACFAEKPPVISRLGTTSPLHSSRKATLLASTALTPPSLPAESLTLNSTAAPKPTNVGAKILLGALTAVSGLAGLAGTASVLIHNAHKTPAELQAASVRALLAQDTPLDQPSPETLAQLQKSLAPVSPQILNLAHKEGVCFQLVEPGADLMQAKVLRLQPKSYIHDQLPQLSAFTQKISGQQVPQILDQLEASRLPLKFFSVPIPGNVSPTFDVLQMIHMQSSMPASLHQMALVHGAKSPEDIQEFTGLVRAINGPKVDQAIQETVDRMVDMKRATSSWNQKPFTPQDEAALRASLSKNPQMVPINHRDLNVLVPDLFYKQVNGQTFRLDGHDRGSLESWSGQADAKGELQIDGKINGENNGVRGQYFYKDDVKRILMRSSEVGKRTPIHELGHALDHLLEKRDPQFYAAWKAEVQKDYDAMMKNVYGPEGGTQPITEYAETNVGEYIAEGFAHFHLSPDEFKAKDPKFYGAIDRFLGRLQQLDSAQPQQPKTLGQLLGL